MSAPEQKVAPRVTGIAHVFAATGYSLAGMVRLWGETAFRHEVGALVASLGLLAGIGAGPVELAALVGLFLILFAVEALNTAVECIVDRISPEWEEYARNAKDLGSFAVMCLLLTIVLFVAVVVWGHLALFG
ncbi:diacylglycerol kinase [Jannaschia pohangensis]|uniref:Diacylglycerol kinase n=1 Tax=Jannaschia pohangensis TaxID=390807 RepID=A0A1I3UI36_9RHOB|nr:diacylglycerol kinase [Jannaschia pohangensis]SFJ82353.1 diacylglycerol kinase [Jannaschia pohangensis]